MGDKQVVAAILAAGMLMRMPESHVSGDPERDRMQRATEAVEAYLRILKALEVASRVASPGGGRSEEESARDR